MTVGEAVRFPAAFYPTGTTQLLEQILDHFELARRAKIRRLSGGQRAQVSLALAVAPDPELLILDDPTLGLDTVVRRDFLESLIQIIQRQGRTILFSSHILGDVERVADRIGILVDGVLRVDCPTEHFKESIRKVVLEFDGEPPEFPSLPGAGLQSDRRHQAGVGLGRLQRRAPPVGRVALAPVAGSDRAEPGRRLYRIHPRAKTLAADLRAETPSHAERRWHSRSCVRRSGSASVALIFYAVFVAQAMGLPLLPWAGVDSAAIPFVTDPFDAMYLIVSGWLGSHPGSAAVGLGNGVGHGPVPLASPRFTVRSHRHETVHRRLPLLGGRCLAGPALCRVGGHAGNPREPV